MSSPRSPRCSSTDSRVSSVYRNLASLRGHAGKRLDPGTRRHLDSEDVLQEVALRAVRDGRVDEMKDPQARRAFLRGMIDNVVHEMRRFLRRKKRRPPTEVGGSVGAHDVALAPSPWRGPATSADDHDAYRRVVSAYGELRPEDRRIIRLRVEDGLDFDEIAARLSISEMTARKRWGRAKARMREAIRLSRLG